MKRKFSKILGIGLTVAMLASMLVFAVPALATISAPAVTVTPTTISASANYTIKFDTYFGMAESKSDNITVVFPSDTTMPTSYTTNTITVNNGVDTTHTAITSGNVTFIEAARSFLIRIPEAENTTGPAHMEVRFLQTAGIINPGTAGSYTLTVKTSQETTVVDSTAYSITTPVSVSRYNKVGNFVGTYGTLADALSASVDYDTLKLSAGTYLESPTITKNYVTIIATGTAAATIIGSSTTGIVTISGNYTTLDTLTIKGQVIVSSGVSNATIQNSTLSKRSSTSVVSGIVTNNGTDLTVKNSTIDLTSGTVADIGLKMNVAGATAKFSGVTFKVDADAGLVSDKAIQTSAALTTATNSLVVETSTFTGDGTGGIGYSDAVGSVGVVIKTSTFDKLEKAIDIAGASANATIQGNTIKNSILVGTGTASKGAIEIGANAAVTVEGNTIKDNKGYSLKVTANADKVTVSGNSLSGNTLGLRNETSTSLNAKLNWWGATTGPTHAIDNPTGKGEIISDDVTFKPFLTADASAARTTTTTAGTASSFDASTTVGVAVSGVTTTGAAQLTVSKLAANPQTVAPAYTPLTGAWFDIYISEASSTTINAKFYATGITSLTQVYFWSGAQGKWVAASEQGVSGAGDYVWANIKPSGATVPTIPTTSDLTGTPFVLVAAPAPAPVIATISLTVPAAGATTPVTNVPFTWAGVSGATSYTLVISASADLSSPITATAAGTAYTYTGNLSYSTAYYWQVTALKDTTVSGKSDIATFITVAAPVVVPPKVVAPITIVSPVVGATNVPLEPILTWTAYAGALGYEVVVSEDKAFAILTYSVNVDKDTTFYKSGTLLYGTTYYWRVRGQTTAMTYTAKGKPISPKTGPWANGIFTTESKPVPPAKVEPTIIIQKEPAPPAQIVEVPVQTIVPQQIPSYLLWIIIAVGAVLVIALIVLIARTRRVT